MAALPTAPRRLAVTWRAWAVSYGVTALVAAVFARGLQDDIARRGGDVAWASVFLDSLPAWTVWATAAPLIAALGYALPLGGPGWPRRALLHGAAGAAWVVVATALSGAIDWWRMAWPPDRLWAAMLPRPMGFSVDLALYLAVAGIGTLILWRARARAAETRAQALELERTALESELARSELHVLRARLQPHFLFNALNAVGVLARKGDGPGAVSMIAGLGDLLRAAIDGQQRDMIPLAEEAALVRRYLEIQRVRYGDALTWSLEVGPEALGLAVPCLLLQPVVENAIVHGLERGAGGDVRVDARVVDGRLSIAVLTRGASLPAGWTLASHAGEGLSLTAERLRRRYPGRHAFSVTETPDGVEARFDLPAGAAVVRGEEEPACAR